MTAIDSHEDAQIDAVAALLYGSIRNRFGVEACSKVYKWPLRLDLAPMAQFPCLVVYVPSERQERSDTDDDIRATTLRVDYYAPTTPLDRIEARWPLLRAVWTHCLSRLRIGYDPAISSGDKIMQAAGFEVPGPTTAATTYQAAQVDTGIVPSLSATVTLGVSQAFDWSDYEGVDLAGIDTEATHLGDPQNDVPSWAATTDL